MSDNQLLIIGAALVVAGVLLLRPVFAWVFKRDILPPNPFVVVLVEFPVGSIALYALLYVTYVMYFTRHP